MSIRKILEQKGFTLLEVLISLVIASMLIILTSQMLSKILQYTQRAQVRGQVSQDMQYAVEIVKRNLRQTDYTQLGRNYYDYPTGFNHPGDNVCAVESVSEVQVTNGKGCGVRLVQSSYYPVFYMQSDHLFYTDSQGQSIQISPDTVKVDYVSILRKDLPPVNPRTAYIQIKMTLSDTQGVLEAHGDPDAELVNIDTGVFIRKYD